MKPTAILLKLLPILLVLCMLFTSCVTKTPSGDNGIGTGETGTHHSPGETTGEPETNEPETDDPSTDTTAPACTHPATTVTGKLDATCGVAGFTGNTVCSTCGELITEGTVIEPTGNHTWGEAEVTKAPTCIATGESTQYCTVCHTATKKTPIDKVAHKNEYHELTGDNKNHILGCETCDKSESQAHQPVDSGRFVAATCTEDAYTLLHCSLCQADYKVTQAGTARGTHTWGEWTTSKEVSCAEDGEMRRDCEFCDEYESSVVPKATALHELNRVSYSAATCDMEGEEFLRCACGAQQETKTLTKIAHNYVETSNDGEWIHSKCSACGNVVSQYIATEKTADITVSEIPAEKPFEINLGGTKIEFPTEVVNDMKENGTSSSFKAEPVQDKTSILESETLDANEKASIEAGEIYNFEAPVSNFGTETPVKITMPYTLNGDQDPDAIVIWYIDKNNNLNKVDAVAYDADTQTVTFEVTHFSYYAIVYHETQELKCSKGDHGDNLEVVKTVEATCYSNGYTVKECKVCHRTVYTDYQDRLAHEWGDLIPFVPQHCGDSGYSKKVCSKCETEKLIEFVPAKGHKAMPATCEAASVCQICEMIISPAKGHSWNEWVTVKEPTDVEKGLKRRNCPVCGKEEFVTLAATGNITELVFGSYQELAEYLLHNVIGLDKDGQIMLQVTEEARRTSIDVKLDVNGASYTMLIEATVLAFADPSIPEAKDEVVTEIRILYRNGVIVFANDGEDAYYGATDIESVLTRAFGMQIEDLLTLLEQAFDSYINPYFEYGYGEATATLDELLAICDDELDAYFKENNIAFTTQELKDALKSIENVYVYLALKMGYDTNLEWQGMELPSRADLVNILDAFCTKTTDANGNTTYTFDGDGKIAAAIDALYTWLEENAEQTIGDLLFELYKEDILAALPEAKSWEDVAEFIITELDGEMTAKALIEKLIAADALETVYVTVDYLVNKTMGGDGTFSCEAWLVNNSKLTLNELCTNQFGATWDDMLAAYIQMPNVTLSELTISTPDGDLPLVEMLMMIKTAYIDSIRFTLADLEVVVSSEGKLLQLQINTDIDLLIPDEAEEGSNGEETETPVIHLIDIGFNIDRTTDITIEIPSDLASLASGKVTYTYDAEGNLIISGLNKDVDYEFDVEGSYQDIELKDIVVRDDKMSAELGYDVYVLQEKYWSQHDTIGEYLLGADGKYYTFTYEYESSYTKVVSELLLSDILANPAILLPAASDQPIGEYQEFMVYSSELGDIFQDAAGVWQLIDRNRSDWNMEYRYENGTETRVMVYHYVESAPLLEVAASLELSNGRPAESYDIKGDYQVYTLNFNAAGLDKTISVYAYIKDNAIYCLETAYVPYRSYYVIGDAVTTLPDCDYIYNYTTSAEIRDSQGNVVNGTFEMLRLEKYVPTYYTCFDGLYFPIREYEGSMFVEIENIDIVTDGSVTIGDKVLYLLGVERVERSFGNDYVTEAKIGYIKVKDNLYIAAVALYNGDQLIQLCYQNRYSEYLQPMGESIITSAPSKLVDLDTVVRREDGSYMVPKALLDTLRATLDEPGEYFGILIETSYKNADGKEVNEFYMVGTEALLPELSFGGGVSSDTEAISIYLGNYFVNNSGDMSGYDITANEDGSFTLTFKSGLEIEVNYSGNTPVIHIPSDDLVKNEEMSEQTGFEIYDLNRYKNDETYFIKENGKYYHYTVNWKYYVSQCYDGTLIEFLKSTGYFSNINRFTTEDASTSIEGEVLYRADLIAYGYYDKVYVPVYFKLENGELKVLTGVDDSSAGFTYEGTTTLSAYLDSLTLEKVDEDVRTVYWTMPDDSALYGERVYLKDGDRILGEYTATYYLVNGQRKYIVAEAISSKGTLVKGEEFIKPESAYSEETWDAQYENGSYVEGFFNSYKIIKEQYVLIAGKYYDYCNDYCDWSYNTYKDRLWLEEDFIRNNATEYAAWYYFENGKKVYVKLDSFNEDGTVTHVPFGDMGDTWLDQDYSYNQYYDAEGRKIFETVILVPEQHEVTVIDANTKYLYFPGRGTGYIAYTAADGTYYSEAYTVTDENGNVSYILRDVDATVRFENMSEFECFADMMNLIVVNGNTVTFTKEFMELFKESKDVYNYMTFEFYADRGEYGNMNCGRLELYELLEYNKKDEQYPDDDFVDINGDGYPDYDIDSDGIIDIIKPEMPDEEGKYPVENPDYNIDDLFKPVEPGVDVEEDVKEEIDNNGEEDTKEPVTDLEWSAIN